MAPNDGPLNIVTIDGPAGVGKSSVARRVARSLGYFHLDTGAMYRAVTLACLRRGLASPPPEEARVGALVAALRMEVGDGGRIWLDDEEVTRELRSPAVTGLVSPVSALSSVRHAMVDLQRRIGTEQAKHARGVVVEGRDAGSFIFPTARWRFYLDASLAERARRRLAQQGRPGAPRGDLAAAMDQLAERDRIDRERSFAPLRIPDGATILDTTHLSEDEVVAAIRDRIVSSATPADPPAPPS